MELVMEPVMKEDYSQVYKKYYSRLDVLFEIVKCLGGRETSLLQPKDVDTKSYPVRCIKAHNVLFLKKNLDAYTFYDRSYNIYYSLAKLKDMPVFSFAPKIRRNQQNKFNDDFLNYCVGYDLGIDFDIHGDNYEEDLSDCIKEIIPFKDSLDYYEVPYSLRYSGSGFHICIPNKALLPMEEYNEDKPLLCSKLTSKMKDIFFLEHMDESIYDIRRIWKCPYSLDMRTCRISLPLSDDDFNNFSLDLVNPKRVFSGELSLRNRGLLERRGSIDGLRKFSEEVLELS